MALSEPLPVFDFRIHDFRAVHPLFEEGGGGQKSQTSLMEAPLRQFELVIKSCESQLTKILPNSGRKPFDPASMNMDEDGDGIDLCV